MNPPATKAAEVLEALMEEEGWNTKDLEAATSLSYSTVLRWLDGSVNPSPKKIADAIKNAGKDPAKYGLTGPRVATGAAWASEMPLWFDKFLSQQAIAREQDRALLMDIQEKIDMLLTRVKLN